MRISRFFSSLSLLCIGMLSLLSLAGCSSSSPSQQASSRLASSQEGLPASLQSPKTPEELLMRRALTLVQDSPTETLQSLFQGEVLTEEKQWTHIEAQGQRYRVVTVYNRFASEAQTEYYVLSYEVPLKRFGKRFPIRDIRFVVKGDTAYLSEVSSSAAEIRRKWGTEQGLAIYELLGYEFEDAPSHGQLHYWSPQVGTVFQYFGQQASFELMEASRLTGVDLPALREKIRQQLPEK